jgi:outer membrane immunogenic protein
MTARKSILGLALTSVLALSASANAADMYRTGPAAMGGYKDGPAYVGVNWTGFYAGVNGGGAWSNENQLEDPVVPFGGVSPAGGFGGGQIGYNWQGYGFGPSFVFGIEADIQGSGITDKQFDILGDSFKSNLDFFGTVRGRLGYAMDRTLFYFTGGFAYGGLHKRALDFPGDFKFDDTATGYVLGGGVEYKFTPAWSLKLEYQYLNFGKNDPVDVSGNGLGTFSNFTGVSKDDDYHTVRVGVNYQFQPGYEPLK